MIYLILAQMAFSRITITFNVDFVIGDNLDLISNPPLNTIRYDWVLNRTSSNEVSQGSFTGIVGERAAINYAEAFQSDQDSTVYDVTQSNNQVVIVIKNEVEMWQPPLLPNPDYTLVIDSIATPPNPIVYDRINTRSPYFIYAPIYTGSSQVVPESALFELFVWSGDISSDKPSSPNYTYYKLQRFAGDQTIYLDISEQVQDFIEQEYNGSFGFSCVFVSWKSTTTHSDGVIIENKTVIGFDGYTEHFDGVNFVQDKDLMLSNNYISIKKGETLDLPFYTGGDEYTIEFRINEVVESTENVTFNNILNTSSALVLISDTANDINNVKIINDNTLEESIIDVEIIEECIYNPIKATFINKFGVQQGFWFFKSNSISQQIESSDYKRNVLNESIVNNKPLISYNTSMHQKVKHNTNGNTSITLNSGYIDEDNNELIRQMLLSNNIWLEVNNKVIPVNLLDKSVSYLTKRNDQLIKYSLKFEYSYNDVQSIR